jgi:hypothetical protein
MTSWTGRGGGRSGGEHPGGQSGVCATGFCFTDAATGEQIAGPLTAILAVAGPDLTRNPKPDDPHIYGRPAAAGRQGTSR